MHYGKNHHFEADEHGVKSDGNVALRNLGGGLDDIGGGEEIKDYHLPERKENDELDAEKLEERLVRLDFVRDADVKGNQKVHGDRDGNDVEEHGPEMRKRRMQ